jgi:tight adherence protein B
MMASFFAAVAVFLLGAGAVIGVFALVAWMPGALVRHRVSSRLEEVRMPVQEERSDGTVLKREVEGALPALDRLAARTSYGSALGKLIHQAGARVSPSTVLLASVVLAAVGAFAISIFVHLPAAWAAGALVGVAVPFIALSQMRKKRLHRFEEQFPEALELLSRAIRAGHAFTTGMGMVADEAPDPIGPEFRKTFDEQNYGLPLKEALNNMTERVPLLDVRFFTTAVLIQRETGGNLSEILDNLAHVVRERFKILRQVRVHTAHGRYTGYVLMALPAFLAAALSFINPEHMNQLFRESMGQMMLGAAIGLQIVGYLWISRVVKIEV